jgi:hypothetical protein
MYICLPLPIGVNGWCVEGGLKDTVFCQLPISFSGVGLNPLGTAVTSGLLYEPQMIDEGDCGEIGGLKIGRGNRSTRRKPTPAILSTTNPT